MPFEYRWHIKGRVILVNACGDLSLQSFQQLTTMEYPGQHLHERLHTIMYTDEINTTPPVQQLIKLQVAPNRGRVILISKNDKPFGRFVATVTLQLLDIDMRIVSTLAEAQAMLEELDSSLPADEFPDTPYAHPLLGTID